MRPILEAQKNNLAGWVAYRRKQGRSCPDPHGTPVVCAWMMLRNTRHAQLLKVHSHFGAQITPCCVSIELVSGHPSQPLPTPPLIFEDENGEEARDLNLPRQNSTTQDGARRTSFCLRRSGQIGIGLVFPFPNIRFLDFGGELPVSPVDWRDWRWRGGAGFPAVSGPS